MGSSPQKRSQDTEAAELRGELSHVLKERAALQVILGSKMRPLVLDLQHSLTDLLSDQARPACCPCNSAGAGCVQLTWSAGVVPVLNHVLLTICP